MLRTSKEIELSFKIEEFAKDEDVKTLLEQTTQWTLVDSLQLKNPVWADEWYVPRCVYTYKVDFKPGMELMAEHLLSLLINNDILN